ncbi:hypothetical protein OAJ60_00280 [Planctomycetaceae bacterium]|nr:hypothetical protein [Planctomycetaceae bacterium]
MASVFESATGQKDRQVAGMVGVGVAEIASKENRRVVQQGGPRFQPGFLDKIFLSRAF